MQNSATRVLITGANRGIGYSLVEVILNHAKANSYDIIMTSRDLEAGKHAIQNIKKQFPEASLDLRQLDITSKESIDKLVNDLKSEPKLNILVNNAGIFIHDKFDIESFKIQMQTNYHGPVYLTEQIVKAGIIKKNADSRIIMVSSGMGKFQDLSTRNPDAYTKLKSALSMSFPTLRESVTAYEADYASEVTRKLWPGPVYAMTKLFLSMWTNIYGTSTEPIADDIQVCAVCPGYCLTDMTKAFRQTPPFTATDGAEHIYSTMAKSPSDAVKLRGMFINSDGVVESLESKV